MNKGWKPSQKDFLCNWGCHLTVADSAPGSGKTTLIMAICLQFLRHSSPCRIFIAEPNKVLCDRLHQSLSLLAQRAQLAPAITRIGFNEASGPWGKDHLEEYVSSQVHQKLHLEGKVLAAVDRLLEFLKMANDYIPASKRKAKPAIRAAVLEIL